MKLYPLLLSCACLNFENKIMTIQYLLNIYLIHSFSSCSLSCYTTSWCNRDIVSYRVPKTTPRLYINMEKTEGTVSNDIFLSFLL